MMYVQQLISRRPLTLNLKATQLEANSEMIGLLSSRQYELGGRIRRLCTFTTTGVSTFLLVTLSPKT